MSVATAVYDQTCHICDTIKKYLLTFYYKTQRNKQLSANQKIYDTQMQMDKDKNYHLRKMNESTIKEYDLKMQKLWSTPIEYDGL